MPTSHPGACSNDYRNNSMNLTYFHKKPKDLVRFVHFSYRKVLEIRKVFRTLPEPGKFKSVVIKNAAVHNFALSQSEISWDITVSGFWCVEPLVSATQVTYLKYVTLLRNAQKYRSWRTDANSHCPTEAVIKNIFQNEREWISRTRYKIASVSEQGQQQNHTTTFPLTAYWTVALYAIMQYWRRSAFCLPVARIVYQNKGNCKKWEALAFRCMHFIHQKHRATVGW